jgi:hypothetical protein
MSTDADALRLVDDFERDGSAGGVWRAITKAEVVSGLRERIGNKDGLNQHNTGLCATASLIHIQLQDDPVSFVTLAIGLYKAGQAPWRGKVVQPTAELMANPPPPGLIQNGAALTFNRADWIVMSSVRNTANPLDRSQGLLMSDLEKFIRQLGYTLIEKDYIQASGKVPESNARKATEWLSRGYRVIISIDSVMLYTATQTNWGQDGWTDTTWGLTPKGNHNVQLISGIDFFKWYNGWGSFMAVRFEAYTWGEGHRRVPQDWQVPLKVKDFLFNYYGYIAFKN